MRCVLLAAVLALSACSGSDASSDASVAIDDTGTSESTETAGDATGADVAEVAAFIGGVYDAIGAVEAELGGPQRYFEITANAQLINVFVAVDDATAAVAYVYLDGELQPPAPKQTGASGNTFDGDDVRFDAELVASRVADELPSTALNAFSVYGDGVGATYVLAGRSEVGGLLDIVVTADGGVVSVDPI